MSDAEKLREAVADALDELPDVREELRMPRLVAMVEAAGFRIVPEVPTEAMLSAPGNVGMVGRILPRAYAAMLAAAPKVTP